MESIQEYHAALAEAIPVKSDHLERTVIRRLLEHIQSFEAGVSSMYEFLIDKGLMQNDPYKHERTVTEIQVPSNEPFSETDMMHEISMRFSRYVSQWEFLVNIFHISVANLSLRKVKRLLDLLDWVRWSDFSPNSSLQITRAVATIVHRVSKMNDPMAGKIVNSNAAHLRDRTYAIKKELKSLTEFLREAYKWKIRQEVVNSMGIDQASFARNPANILQNVKFEVTHQARKLGWYRELVQELLEEDYGEDAARLRAATLERLKVSSEQIRKKKKKKGPDDTALMMNVVDRLARCGEPIRSALVKMNDNSRTIQERKKSFGERLSEIFSSLFHRSSDKVVYSITIKDAVSGAVRHEDLNYPKFAAIAMTRARTLSALLDTSSEAHSNARNAGAEKLEEFITRYLTEVKGIHRHLEGLDAYFRSDNIPQEIRSSMKACSLNLKNLKSSIADTIRSFNEFKSGRDEREQLRKLGIDD